MDLSGIIFVVLALAWAFYLIPKAVKHHEDVAPARSVDRFSTAMRVLARREPTDPPRGRVVVTPPRSGERVVVPSRPVAEPDERPVARNVQTVQRGVAARRAAARAAARRRRRVLSVLLLADAVMVALGAFAITPWWAIAIPAALTLVFLALCRRQVRRENDALWSQESGPAAGATPARRAVRIDAAYGVEGQSTAHNPGMPVDDDTVRIPVTEAEAVPVVAETADGGSLWDPLPVTLPTYVNKARAARTVRTIDLGAPGTWTSGRDEADSALAGEPTASETSEDIVEHEPRRAVGS